MIVINSWSLPAVRSPLCRSLQLLIQAYVLAVMLSKAWQVSQLLRIASCNLIPTLRSCHTCSALRLVSTANLEVLLWVFTCDAALYSKALWLGHLCLSAEAQLCQAGTSCNLDLGLNDVNTRDLLSHCVLNLW
eukprot:GHUV01050817.1.p1 GENE.GHUV01050817.1~~GHUV01050817.1.p1  ORF type:complete len:133 (+),score=8.85 GHUV01050817.1:105-503(+)